MADPERVPAADASCLKCGRQVPLANIELHELRCGGEEPGRGRRRHRVDEEEEVEGDDDDVEVVDDSLGAGLWECGACTYHNDASASVCSICARPSPNAPSSSASAIPSSLSSSSAVAAQAAAVVSPPPPPVDPMQPQVVERLADPLPPARGAPAPPPDGAKASTLASRVTFGALGMGLFGGIVGGVGSLLRGESVLGGISEGAMAGATLGAIQGVADHANASSSSSSSSSSSASASSSSRSRRRRGNGNGGGFRIHWGPAPPGFTSGDDSDMLAQMFGRTGLRSNQSRGFPASSRGADDLPTHLYEPPNRRGDKERADGSSGGNEEDPLSTCSICLQPYARGDELRLLPCIHRFHRVCVDSWFATGNFRCPVCKTDARCAGDADSGLERNARNSQ